MSNATRTMQSDMFTRHLEDIERDGQTLRKAMMQRKADAIWEAIEAQEQSLRNLQQFYADAGAAGHPETRNQVLSSLMAADGVRELVTRTQSVLSTNRRLASTFLDVIDRTLSRLSTGGQGAVLYGANGKMGSVTAPCFVQQRG